MVQVLKKMMKQFFAASVIDFEQSLGFIIVESVLSVSD